MNPEILIGKDAPLTKLPKSFPTHIDHNLALGLDLGVGSCGQALIYDTVDGKAECKLNMHILNGETREPIEFPNRIAFLGVRTFDIPETKGKTGVKLKNPTRREKRALRSTTRARAWRMQQVRQLLKKHQLLPSDYPGESKQWKLRANESPSPEVRKWMLWHAQMTKGQKGRSGPLELRVRGLDYKLEPLEFAAALLHLTKHRGFRSNRKGESVSEEGGKVITALNENQQRMQSGNYRTIGEMLLKHPDFGARKRNRLGSYTACIQRAGQLSEIELLFEKQRELNNVYATERLKNEFIPLFFDQRPFQNSFKLLGECSFEKGEKRGARFAPSFELARALQRLNALSIKLSDGTVQPISTYVSASKGGYKHFIDIFGENKKITYKTLRKIYALPEEIEFTELPLEPIALAPDADEDEKIKKTKKQISDAEGKDFVTRTRNAAEGTHLLRSALDPKLWDKYWPENSEPLDHLAFALTFFEEVENTHQTQEHWGILNELNHAKIPQELIEAVAKDLDPDRGKPTLAKFAGATSMSTLASRKLIPLLSEGMVYSEACSKIYGDHRQSHSTFNDITNPVVQSVVREVLKQVVHLVDEVGALPARINVEIGRDIGKSIDERNRIDGKIKERTTQKKKNAEQFKKQYFSDPSPDEILAYELYLEQSTQCPYCDSPLPQPHTWRNQPLDIDHILPRSRSHDNSYDNKVLVHPSCNRDKTNKTPSEWLGTDTENWRILNRALAHMPRLRPRKRKNLLNTTFAQDEAKFASRHLNDTRYISTLVTHYLHTLYEGVPKEKPLSEKGATRRVFVQPGALTALVRKSWGLENLKKDRAGRRLGDKHHAIDALICALLSEGQRQFITKREQEKDAACKVTIFSDFSRSYQLMEEQRDHCRTPRHISPPWPDFRNDVVSAIDLFTVSRRENRRGRGALHKDTIYRTEYENEEVIAYCRKALIDPSTGKPIFSILGDLDKVKDIHLERNLWLKHTLTKWIQQGTPIDEPKLPRDPQGALIRKVTIRQGKKSGRYYPQGFVTGGNLVRVDVFLKTNKKGNKNYYLVPIYSHHLTLTQPPNRAIKANTDESQWDEMTADHQFEFSLWPNSRFHVLKKNGEEIYALYDTVDRNTAKISYSNPDDQRERASPPKGSDVPKTKGVSVKQSTLIFRKLETDRLGRIFPIKSEKRTWRGTTID